MEIHLSIPTRPLIAASQCLICLWLDIEFTFTTAWFDILHLLVDFENVDYCHSLSCDCHDARRKHDEWDKERKGKLKRFLQALRLKVPCGGGSGEIHLYSFLKQNVTIWSSCFQVEWCSKPTQLQPKRNFAWTLCLGAIKPFNIKWCESLVASKQGKGWTNIIFQKIALVLISVITGGYIIYLWKFLPIRRLTNPDIFQLSECWVKSNN